MGLAFFGAHEAIGLLAGDRRPKYYLILSVVFCLAILGFFKYFNFFTDSFNLRPGLMLDARDKLPFHLTLDAHVGYLVSIVAGDYLHGAGPISTANVESQEVFPMLVDLVYSPLDRFSLKGTFGYLYDLLPVPDTPDETEIIGRADAVWTASNRFDLRVFFQGNWYTGALGFVPQLGLGVTYRL